MVTAVPVSISIHAAREGGDINRNRVVARRKISIHAAREGGDRVGEYLQYAVVISIHAAREGGDVISPVSSSIRDNFNPRRP